jgi:hypothetical protein
MEVDIAGRGHDDPLRLKRPPFAADNPDAAVIDRVAEHRSRKRDLTGGQGSFAVHDLLIATPMTNGNLTCRPSRSPLGQRKI